MKILRGHNLPQLGNALIGHGMVGAQLVIVLNPSFNLTQLKVGNTLSSAYSAGIYTHTSGIVSEASIQFFVDGVAQLGSYVISAGDVDINADVSLNIAGVPSGIIITATPSVVQNTIPQAASSATALVNVTPGDGSGDATAPAAMAAPTLTSTATKITITKAADPADGGSPITGFEYRYSINGGTSWSTPASISAPVTVTGFTAGFVGVLVQTRAINAIDSDPANWSSSATINMKIPTLVGQKTFSPTRNSVNNVISLTDLTGGIASAPAADDCVVLAYASGCVTSRAIQVAAGDAYSTFVAKLYRNSSTNDLNFWVGYKIMGPTPDTVVNVVGTGSSTDAGAIVIQVWRYIDGVVPLDGVAPVQQIGDGGQPVFGAITPNSAHALILCMGAGAGGTTVDFTSSDLTNFLSFTSASTIDVACAIGSKDWTSGAFTASTWGGGEAGAGNARASVVAALRPN